MRFQVFIKSLEFLWLRTQQTKGDGRTAAHPLHMKHIKHKMVPWRCNMFNTNWYYRVYSLQHQLTSNHEVQTPQNDHGSVVCQNTCKSSPNKKRLFAAGRHKTKLLITQMLQVTLYPSCNMFIPTILTVCDSHWQRAWPSDVAQKKVGIKGIKWSTNTNLTNLFLFHQLMKEYVDVKRFC